MVWGYAIRARDLEVVFLDVGQGDGAFIRFPNGRTMVVDAGSRSRRFDSGASVLLPFLRDRGVRRIDVVIASHPHNDHVGGLVALLEKLQVSHYVDSGQAYESWTATRLHTLIRKRNVSYHRVAAGDSLVGLGGVGGLVLHPTPAFVSEEGRSPQSLNNGSVVFRLDYGETSLLFTGDIEAETDSFVNAWETRLAADILKVPHHGSPTSSGANFVRLVGPDLSIVSVGGFNKFGHPSASVLNRLESDGSRVIRTDESGAVIIRSDGSTFTVGTMVQAADPEPTTDGRPSLGQDRAAVHPDSAPTRSRQRFRFPPVSILNVSAAPN